jgi:predicted NAD/FAD-binding protein
MLTDLLRFNREAARLADSGAPLVGTLGEFLDAGGYGREVRELYLIPMAACIWSTPATAPGASAPARARARRPSCTRYRPPPSIN